MTEQEQYVQLTSPVPTQSGGAEVWDFFWYGDTDCYAFAPLLGSWQESHSEVRLRKVPAMFGGIWDLHGQMFLALDALGLADGAEAAIYEAVQKSRKRLATAQDQADFLATQGVDRDAYLAAFGSFAVGGKVAQARQLPQQCGIQGIPALIVNGAYRTDLGLADGPENVLDVVDQLLG